MRRPAHWIVALLACSIVLGAHPLEAQESLRGAWQGVEAWGDNADGEWRMQQLQPTLYLFLDGHYSIMYVAGNEARPLMPEDATRESISEEQMRSIFMPFIANSGTYEVEGSTVTTDPMVALWPNYMESGTGSFDFEFEEGALVLTFSGEGAWSKVRLRRLE